MKKIVFIFLIVMLVMAIIGFISQGSGLGIFFEPLW